jgi:hypothetical protein
MGASTTCLPCGLPNRLARFRGFLRIYGAEFAIDRLMSASLPWSSCCWLKICVQPLALWGNKVGEGWLSHMLWPKSDIERRKFMMRGINTALLLVFAVRRWRDRICAKP